MRGPGHWREKGGREKGKQSRDIEHPQGAEAGEKDQRWRGQGGGRAKTGGWGSIPLTKLRSAGRSPLTAPSWRQAVLSPEADAERSSKAWPLEAPVPGEEDRQAHRRVCGSVQTSCMRPGAGRYLPRPPTPPPWHLQESARARESGRAAGGESGCEQGHG